MANSDGYGSVYGDGDGDGGGYGYGYGYGSGDGYGDSDSDSDGHGRMWNQRANLDTELLASMKAERDDADRRAGAAERTLEVYREESRSRNLWLSKAKEAAGYDDGISFDRVWAEALAALKEKRAALAEQEQPE